MPKSVEKDIVVFVPQEWDVVLTPINPVPKKPRVGKAGDRPEVLPKWVEALEPVRKMSTNLGTKIKIQVQESLDAKPPDWAKGTLEWSLSKGTFKSNAAGTTKVLYYPALKIIFYLCRKKAKVFVILNLLKERNSVYHLLLLCDRHLLFLPFVLSPLKVLFPNLELG